MRCVKLGLGLVIMSGHASQFVVRNLVPQVRLNDSSLEPVPKDIAAYNLPDVLTNFSVPSRKHTPTEDLPIIELTFTWNPTADLPLGVELPTRSIQIQRR